jgi:hypothetical protein
MISELYQIWKDFWAWLNGLSSKTIALVCFGCAVIGCLLFSNYLMYDNLHQTNITPLTDELTTLRKEFAQNDSIIMREIRVLTEMVNEVNIKVSKVILIEAANSKSELIRHLVPYLENAATKQDIYGFVLDLQRDLQQSDTTKYGISVRKKPKSTTP